MEWNIFEKLLIETMFCVHTYIYIHGRNFAHLRTQIPKTNNALNKISKKERPHFCRTIEHKSLTPIIDRFCFCSSFSREIHFEKIASWAVSSAIQLGLMAHEGKNSNCLCKMPILVRLADHNGYLSSFIISAFAVKTQDKLRLNTNLFRAGSVKN